MTPRTSARTTHYRDQVLAEIATRLDPAALSQAVEGLGLSPAELARRMVAVVPTRTPANRMAEQVGPEFFDTAGVMVTLAGPGGTPISKQAVEQRRKRHSLVALRTADAHWIYPTWQFGEHGVVAGLSEVLAVFRDHDAWSTATWMTTALDDLGGQSPRAWLLAGRDLDALLTVARRTARRWAA